MLGVVDVTPASTIVVATLAELALFAVLFTDGMRVGWADLRTAWRLPGRALGLGAAADPARHRAARPLRRRAATGPRRC